MGQVMVIETPLGTLELQLRPDAAPATCNYIERAIEAGLYDGTSFYRSDFVIQGGLHGKKKNPFPDLAVNETKLPNLKGTAAIAHFDVPDCGNTEFFINLQDNPHLNTAYGGYAVFAEVIPGAPDLSKDIASAVLNDGSLPIISVNLRSSSR